MLPENKRRTPEENNDKLTVLLYGVPMSGKTTLVDKIDNVLFINTDRNTNDVTNPVIFLETAKADMTKTYNDMLTDLYNILDDLMKDDTYEVVCFDLFRDIIGLTRNAVLESRGFTHESQANDFGATWTVVADARDDLMKRIKALPQHVILIDHAKEEEKENAFGGIQSHYKPVYALKIWNEITGTLSGYGFLDTEYNVNFVSGDNFEAKSRTSRLPEKTEDLRRVFNKGEW